MSLRKISTKIFSRPSFVVVQQVSSTMIVFTVVLVLFPILLVLRLLTWLIVVVVIKWKNRGATFYGKLIAYGDVCVDEPELSDIVDMASPPPRLSIVTTIQLENGASLSLDHVRRIFVKNVLKATIISGNKQKPRYPEMQQYLSSLLGFRVWKQDPNFNIANHIVEQVLKEKNPGPECFTQIHNEMINKPYQKDKSPWEVVLVRLPSQNVVLACRTHHTLGDVRSLLELFVECLGQKPLTFQTTVNSDRDKVISKRSSCCGSFWCSVGFYLAWPWRHWIHLAKTVLLLLRNFRHPWKMEHYRRRRFSTALVQWSAPLELEAVERVAKEHGVSLEALFMGICAGAIRKCQEDVLGKRDMAVGYQLGKEGHPPYLANHSYIGILKLPTGESCGLKRLTECHVTLESAKTANVGRHFDFFARVAATVIPYPIANYFTVNRFVPVKMSFIRGDTDGFSMRDPDLDRTYECTDFRVSMGTFKGVAGVMLCASSYKGTLRIGVVANETVLERRQVEMLAENMTGEFSNMKMLIVKNQCTE